MQTNSQNLNNKNMKYILRIPMADQYSYTELICDTKEEYDEAKMDYSTYKSLSTTNGLSEKEWRDTLDRYLQENKMSSEVWDKMNNEEKIIINEIKKSVKRLETKQ